MRVRIQAPRSRRGPFEQRLGRRRIDPPSQDPRGRIQEVGHALEKGQDRRFGCVASFERRVDDRGALLRPGRPSGPLPPRRPAGRSPGRRRYPPSRRARAACPRRRPGGKPELPFERSRPELVGGCFRRFDEPQADLGREAPAGVEKVDAHLIQGRERALAGFLLL